MRLDGLDWWVVLGKVRQISGSSGRLSHVLRRERRTERVAPATVGIGKYDEAPPLESCTGIMDNALSPNDFGLSSASRMNVCFRIMASFVVPIVGLETGTIFLGWRLSVP